MGQKHSQPTKKRNGVTPGTPEIQDTTLFTRKDLDSLIYAHAKAETKSQTQFTWKGSTLDTQYASYLIQWLDSVLK